MTKLHLVQAPQTNRATATLAERLAKVGPFVDAERIRKGLQPGWFEAAEDELERQMLEIRRGLTPRLDPLDATDNAQRLLRGSCSVYKPS